MRPLQDDEEPLGGKVVGALEVEVLVQHLGDDAGQRQRALLVALPLHPQAPIQKVDIADTQEQDFARAQAAEEHQVDDGEVAMAPERAQEHPHLLARQRLDRRTRHLDAKLQARRRLHPVNAQYIRSRPGRLKYGAGTPTPGAPRSSRPVVNW